MKESEYFNALRKDAERRLEGLSPKTVVLTLPIDSIETNDEEGGTQCRAGGFVQSHVVKIALSIEAKGQQTPITVEIRNGKYFAVDGNHRLKALRSLAKQHEGTDEATQYQKVTAVVKTFASDIERIDYQDRANERLPSQSNTRTDILETIKALRDAGDQRVPKVPTDPNKYTAYEKEMMAFVKGRWASTSSPEVAHIVKEFTKNLPGQKIRNIEKEDLEAEFIAWDNQLDWTGRQDNKEGIPGWKLYTAAKSGGAYPTKSILSYCVTSKSSADEGFVKTAVIVWDNKPLGKNEKQMNEYRRSVVEAFNKLNSSHMFKKGVRVVDKIFIAAQKKASKVAEHGFFEVEVRNNKFVTAGFKGIPQSGWNHMSLKEEN